MRSVFFLILGAIALVGCNRQPCHEGQVVEQTYIHRYGVEVTPNDWESRGGSGQIVSIRRDGVKVTTSYLKGIQDGPTTYTYPHSDIIARTEVYDDAKMIKEIKHFTSGTPQEEIYYSSADEKTITTWYSDGCIWKKEVYRDDRLANGEYYGQNNKLEARVDNGYGERVCRDNYYNLEYRDQIQNGQTVARTTFHPNGNPKEITPYVNNIIEGMRRTFLPEGEPNTIEEWYSGMQHGITTLFQNGEKIAEIPYVKGIKNGIERRYSAGSDVVEEITWVSGTKHGPYHTHLGNKVQTDWYHQGKLVNKAMYDLLSRPAKPQI